MKFLNKKLGITILVLGIMVIPVLSLAQVTGPAPTTPGTQIINPLGNNNINTINDFIRVLLEGALKIGIPLIALAIIYSGFLFVMARGNSEKLSTAKDALMYSLIGGAILLGSWAIARLITETVLGISS